MKRNISAIAMTAAMVLVSAMAVYAKSPHPNDVVGAVYTMTNAADNNEVVVFDRDSDGILTLKGTVSTGGIGSGGELDALASQGSLVLSDDHRWLLTVNAGSNEISVFRVKRDGLDLVDIFDSGGEFPVSLTVFHDLVYVLNAGMSSNITGFYLNHRGRLVPLDNSSRLLGMGGFAQVGFDPRGRMLVVTDRDENEILVYSVDGRGIPSANPVTSMSNGLAPFGFIFDERGILLVSEAGSGAVSTYEVLPNGELRIISPSVANGQTATCWIAGNMRGNIFTSNTGSQTISAYELLSGKGAVGLLDATAGLGNRPIDMAVTVSGRFLYALDPANGGIDSFRINRDGSLTSLGSVAGGLSIFAQGIAAR